MNKLRSCIKIVGTHALINGALAVGVTVMWDAWKLADAWKAGKL